MAKECDFKAVDTLAHKNEAVLSAFISGISNSQIRQKILSDCKELNLDDVLRNAKTTEMAIVDSAGYVQTNHSVAAVSKPFGRDEQKKSFKPICDLCGFRHKFEVCPARNAKCFNCEKTGHFSRKCKEKRSAAVMNSPEEESEPPLLAAIEVQKSVKGPSCLRNTVIDVMILEQKCSALLYSGSSDCFISKQLVDFLKMPLKPADEKVGMAVSSSKFQIT